MLAPYACSSERSRGRRYDEPLSELRTEFQRDRDRVIHSGAFRRLEYKTQVFVNHRGDMFRTRLTHSLEVAQIARLVARHLRLDEDLTEAICLAHDVGHAPFGHAGQSALNRVMREYGGFEHNLQALRVVDQLEERFPAFPGLNLTFETREGILKHCSAANARQLGALGQRFLSRTQPSLEAQVADLCDEIAYSHHDIDDALRSGILTLDDMREVPVFAEAEAHVGATWPGMDERRLRYAVLRQMEDRVLRDLIAATGARLRELAPASVDAVRAEQAPIVGLSDEALERHRALKHFLFHRFYRHERVASIDHLADEVVGGLFAALMADACRAPMQLQAALREVQTSLAKARLIADYIAGMTDRFALSEFERLTGPMASLSSSQPHGSPLSTVET